MELKSCCFVATSIKRRIPYSRSVSSIDQALLGAHFSGGAAPRILLSSGDGRIST